MVLGLDVMLGGIKSIIAVSLLFGLGMTVFEHDFFKFGDHGLSSFDSLVEVDVFGVDSDADFDVVRVLFDFVF